MVHPQFRNGQYVWTHLKDYSLFRTDGLGLDLIYARFGDILKYSEYHRPIDDEATDDPTDDPTDDSGSDQICIHRL